LCESSANASVFLGAATLFSSRHKNFINQPRRDAEIGAAPRLSAKARRAAATSPPHLQSIQ
jgi:hypothetical protein